MALDLLPPEINSATTLWRYMKVSTFFLLLEGTAFLPSVATLQNADPLEGDLHPDPVWLVKKLEDLSKGESQELRNWLVSKGQDWERGSLQAPDNASFISRLLANIYIRELAKRRAVWCWFSSPSESAGMWSIYGHRGIAVQTTVRALMRALPNNRNFQIAHIRYSDRDPSSLDRFNPESPCNDPRIHRPHLIKGSEYKSENEVRVVTLCPAREKGLIVHGIAVNKLVQEVVISPLLPYEEAKAIKGQISKHPWGERPVIRRSSLLGEQAIDRDETIAAMSKLLGREVGEAGLPPLMDIL